MFSIFKLSFLAFEMRKILMTDCDITHRFLLLGSRASQDFKH